LVVAPLAKLLVYLFDGERTRRPCRLDRTVAQAFFTVFVILVFVWFPDVTGVLGPAIDAVLAFGLFYIHDFLLQLQLIRLNSKVSFQESSCNT